MSLPGASELFRPTQPADADPTPVAPASRTAPGTRTKRGSTPAVDEKSVAQELPIADETPEVAPAAAADAVDAADDPVQEVPVRAPRRTPVAPLSRPSASGRVRHDEKITVYVSADELMALEEARLTLRRQGIAVDRGRIVRAAIALAMADLHEHGDEGDLVAHLLGS